jgi:hypothetical protein
LQLSMGNELEHLPYLVCDFWKHYEGLIRFGDLGDDLCYLVAESAFFTWLLGLHLGLLL